MNGSYIPQSQRAQILARRATQPKPKGRITMLDSFRNFTIDRLDIDELVALAAYGKQLRSEYLEHKLNVPKWVDENLKQLNREIDNRNADARAALKQQLTAQIDALKTPAEKREDLKKKLEELEAVGA